MEDGGPLAGVLAKDLAHRPGVPRALLHERLDPTGQPGQDGVLECEHRLAGADRAEVVVQAVAGVMRPRGVDLGVRPVLAQVVVEEGTAGRVGGTTKSVASGAVSVKERAGSS